MWYGNGGRLSILTLSLLLLVDVLIGGFDFDEDDESTETIKIVTTIRADSLSGMISIESPLGKALLGHKKGDRVLVQVNPQVEYYVVIKSISNTDDSDDNITSY